MTTLSDQNVARIGSLGLQLLEGDVMPALLLFPTTLVGSFPQPEWLIDRARLAGPFPPRVRASRLVSWIA